MEKINKHKVVIGDVYKSRNYGDFKVIRKISTVSHMVRFVDTGYETEAQNSHIRIGAVRDRIRPVYWGVGFVGDGDYKVSGPNASKGAYIVWRNILDRCYNEKCAAYNSYGGVGVSVCSEWHNFQEFANWFYTNYPKDGERYDIDKDILNRDAKIYSPDTCIFVSRSENIAERNRRCINSSFWRFFDPEGNLIEFKNLAKFCREKNLHSGCMGSVFHGKRPQHKGWTSAKHAQ